MDKFRQNILKELNKKDLSENTKETYIKNLLKVRELGNFKQYTINMFKKAEDIIDVLKEHYEPNTQQTIIGSILGLLKGNNKFDDEYLLYRERNGALLKRISDKRDLNKLSDKEKMNNEEWNELKKVMLSKALKDNNSKVNDFNDSILTSLYFNDEIIPRLEFASVKLNNFNKESDNFIEGNKITFNKFKNVKSLGSQTFKLSSKTKKLIQDFKNFRKSKNINDDFLFISQRTNKGFINKKFSDFIIGYFKRYTGKSINNNLLRKIYTDYLVNKPGYSKLTNAERKKMHIRLLHLPETANSVYRKVE